MLAGDRRSAALRRARSAPRPRRSPDGAASVGVDGRCVGERDHRPRSAADVATSRSFRASPSARCGSPSSGRRAASRSPRSASRELVVGRAAAQQRAQVVAARGEEAGVELALGREPRARAVAAERLRHRRDHADLAAAVAVAPALGDLAAVVRVDRLERQLGADRARRSRARARRRPCASRWCAPTSMYSMKRRMWPVPRKWRAIGTTLASFTPRLTTMLILTGASPAAAAASMPSSTFATGKSTSFICRNVASSSESRLTVMRFRPAALQRRAPCARAASRWS